MATTKKTSRTARFRKGDRVEWSSHGGTKRRRGVAVGTVVKKLTAPMDIKGHHVAASTDDPQYLVRSDNGGKAAHKPTALRRSRVSAGPDDGTAKTKTKTKTKKSKARKEKTKKETTKKETTKKTKAKKTKKEKTKRAEAA